MDESIFNSGRILFCRDNYTRNNPLVNSFFCQIGRAPYLSSISHKYFPNQSAVVNLLQRCLLKLSSITWLRNLCGRSRAVCKLQCSFQQGRVLVYLNLNRLAIQHFLSFSDSFIQFSFPENCLYKRPHNPPSGALR